MKFPKWDRILFQTTNTCTLLSNTELHGIEYFITLFSMPCKLHPTIFNNLNYMAFEYIITLISTSCKLHPIIFSNSQET